MKEPGFKEGYNDLEEEFALATNSLMQDRAQD